MPNDMRALPESVMLTPMQSWMFHESIPVQRPWVNLQQIVVRLNGPVSSAATLGRAWRVVAAVHPSLRATIQWRALMNPVQSVAGDAVIAVETQNWTGKPGEVQDAALADFLASDRRRGVDVETAPHWRVTLIHLGAEKSVMVWTVHNALVDATSAATVLEDLISVIDTGEPISAPQTPQSYLAMCRAIGAQTDPTGRTFFAEYLDEFEPLGLTTTSPPSTPDRPAALQTRVLSCELTRALTGMAERCDGSLRSLVQAAWGMVMSRWHNAPDVAIGVTVGECRLAADSDRATGCFLNTLPLRMTFGRDTTLGALVGGIVADTAAMRPFGQVTIAKIRAFCNFREPDFLSDTVVMFDRGGMSGVFQRAGVQSEGRSAELHSEIHPPLALAVFTGDELRLEFETDPAVVSADRAKRMLDHLATLLTSIAAATPDTLLRELDMLGPERPELLALGRPAQETVHIAFLDRFRAEVARDPDAIAVEMAGGTDILTYGMLDAASDRLAAALQAKGAGTGDIVAIHLARSPDYIVSLIAVLKTGAAFMPVDPSYPAPVIRHMVNDSGTRLVISNDLEIAAFDVDIIAPDTDPGGAALRPVARDPEAPAYVIYTSGSTGKPKGVVIPDRAMVAHSQAISREHGLTAEDRVYQFVSLSFDYSLEEILPSLFNGATIVLRSEGAARSGADLLEEISKHAITILNLPTAFFHVVGDYLMSRGADLPKSLRVMSFGGERANPKIVQGWLDAAPWVRFLNGYGPTETAVTCTFFEPKGHLPEGDLPIGTVTDHALCYVAAPDGSLSPRGAVGELWIGGAAVGLGYHGLPEKTADVYFDDHFRGSGRVYRSGDRASWRDDGQLDFHGRKDRQVKMRGFRIDLGHVERVLERARPDLRIVAGTRDLGKPSARLVAWAMAANGNAAVDIDALEALAEAELPAQMRPQIVEVEEFPRTAGGKVDLAALPDPGRPAPPTPVAEPAPATALEAQLAELFGRVLRVANVGVDDDFYNLGGHSLLAADLVGRIEVTLGHKITVIDLQRQPTPRGLAEVVARGSSGPRNLFAIQPAGNRPPLFGVHILGGRESYYKALADAFGPDQPVIGATVGTLARDKPIGVEETAQRYFDEIQQFHPDGPVHLAAVSLGAYFAWELASKLHEAGREIGHFALFDADGPGGRDAHTGLARLLANIRTVQHRGPRAVSAAVFNRINDFRYNRIVARMERQETDGDRIEIRDGTDFIASNELAVSRYVPKPLAVPVTIYRSNENFFDTADCLGSGLGWEPVARAGFEVVDVPGGHLTMLEPPHVKTLAAHMMRAMKI